MRNVPNLCVAHAVPRVGLISRLVFASQILKISHHSQWILTMGRIFSASAPSVSFLLLHWVPGLIFSGAKYVDDAAADGGGGGGGGGDEVALIFAGGPGKLTVGGPLLSIWEVARSQLEHVSLGLLDRLAHDYDDHNEDGQQDEDAAYGHGHHGAVTHAGFVVFPFPLRAHFRNGNPLQSASICRGVREWEFAYFEGLRLSRSFGAQLRLPGHPLGHHLS